MLIGYYFLAWTPRCFQRGTNPSRALLILLFTDKLGEVGRRKSHLAEICQTTKRITILSNSSKSHYNQSSEDCKRNAARKTREAGYILSWVPISDEGIHAFCWTYRTLEALPLPAKPKPIPPYSFIETLYCISMRTMAAF